jgi:hypothetical protein
MVNELFNNILQELTKHLKTYHFLPSCDKIGTKIHKYKYVNGMTKKYEQYPISQYKCTYGYRNDHDPEAETKYYSAVENITKLHQPKRKMRQTHYFFN